MKTALTYHDRFMDKSSNDSQKINIYVNQADGYYFDFITARAKRSLDTIYRPKDKKAALVEDLTTFLLPCTKDRYAELCIPLKRVYLFEGIPGAGKTSFIFALASLIDYDVATVSCGPKFKDTDMFHLFRSMNEVGKSKNRNKLLVLEDLDCLFQERKANDDNRNNVSFSGLLNVIDGFATPDNLICIITTNHIERLDSALVRPGRVDYIMSFTYVVREQIIDIFNAYTKPADKALSEVFYGAVKDLHIRVTFSLLQQYLLKYVNSPAEAIDNIADMKKMYDASSIDKFAEDSGLFS